jgi:hypothetical protein
MEARYDGPYRILRRTRGGTYELKGQDGTIIKRPPSTLKLVSQTMAFDVDSQEVEEILAHQTINDEDWYLVKWKGIPETYNQWVHKKDFNSTGPIEEFWRAKRKRQEEPLKIKFKRPKVERRVRFKE